jgi:hypothetical protein
MGISYKSGIVRSFTVGVSREVVLRRLRMRPEALEKGSELEMLFKRVVDEGCRCIAPAAVYKTMDIGNRTDPVTSFRESGFFVESAGVTRLLGQCSKATLVAATIGDGLSRGTEALMRERRMTEALILDAFGSEAVEEVVNELCNLLQRTAVLKNMDMTMRFSPGYGDWRLETQGAVLDELDAARIGIGISPRFVLIPEKSITAIIGWKP